jgi:tetratricopeptide (TPR) repeat protein
MPALASRDALPVPAQLTNNGAGGVSAGVSYITQENPMTKTEICFALIFCSSWAAQPPAPGTASPAELSIRKTEEEIAKKPDHYPYYNALAMAYARRARETSDVTFYGKAEQTLQQSFAIAPDNYEGLKVKTWLSLGRHEFAKALETANSLNRKMPDDITVYGYLVDANVELGNYAEAVSAAQWMLNLRPGNVAGLTRAAYLRELHGDLSGAIELMQMAYDATAFSESEDRAWLLTQLSHLHLVSGDLEKAETYAQGALGVFPDYHYALGAVGQIRMAQQRYREAAALFQKRYVAARHAENLFAVGEALEKSGRHSEAETVFVEFKQQALKESALADNANHELIAYYTDYAHEPAQALRLAEQELARRHDVFTLDTYAWALEVSGDHVRAHAEMQKALAVGVKDPKLLRHAEIIKEHQPAVARVAARNSNL